MKNLQFIPRFVLYTLLFVGVFFGLFAITEGGVHPWNWDEGVRIAFITLSIIFMIVSLIMAYNPKED